MKTKKKVTRAKKLATPKRTQARSKVARVHIAEGTRLFALAGRPTKAQFVEVKEERRCKFVWRLQKQKLERFKRHMQKKVQSRSPGFLAGRFQ
jgi:hypothetical protein